MAMAVQKVFPDAKVTIGPWIEHGFYYDFDIESLTDKDLKKIKKEMVSLLNITYVVLHTLFGRKLEKDINKVLFQGT